MAKPLYVEALSSQRFVLGVEHPHTLTSLNNLGNLMADMGETRMAQMLLHECVEARRRVLGNEHPETLTSINNLGTLFFDQGDFATARCAQLGYTAAPFSISISFFLCPRVPIAY